MCALSKSLLKKYLEEVEGLDYENVKADRYFIFHDKRFKLREIETVTTDNRRQRAEYNALFGTMGYHEPMVSFTMNFTFTEEGTRDRYEIEVSFDNERLYERVMNILNEYYAGEITKLGSDIDLSPYVRQINVAPYCTVDTIWTTPSIDDSSVHTGEISVGEPLTRENIMAHTHIDEDNFNPDVYVAGGANVSMEAPIEEDLRVDLEEFQRQVMGSFTVRGDNIE